MMGRAIDHSREPLRGCRGLQGQVGTGSDRMTIFSLREGSVCSGVRVLGKDLVPKGYLGC
jgi:hypothetical protein